MSNIQPAAVAGPRRDASGGFELTEARRRNQELNHREFAQRRVTLESRPLALFVELTMNCNLKCPMCRSAEKYQPEYNMDTGMFARLAEELFPTSFIVDLRGYGESTMLPHFAEMVDIALRYRPQLRLVTNGQLNKVDVWHKLLGAHARISISCDAADPALFGRLRLGGHLSALERTVRTIVSLREEYAVPDDHVELLAVASLDNLHDLPEIVSFAARLGLRKVSLFPLQARIGDPAHLHGDLPGVHDAYAATAQRARAEAVQLRLGAAPDAALAVPGMVKTHPCMHPWGYAYIDYAGRVGFCDHLIGSPLYTFGSLATDPFERIWNSPGWTVLRQAHVSGDIPERFFPCRWCFKNRYVDFEEQVHPAYHAAIVSTDTVESVVRPGGPDPEPPLPWMK